MNFESTSALYNAYIAGAVNMKRMTQTVLGLCVFLTMETHGDLWDGNVAGHTWTLHRLQQPCGIPSALLDVFTMTTCRDCVHFATGGSVNGHAYDDVMQRLSSRTNNSLVSLVAGTHHFGDLFSSHFEDFFLVILSSFFSSI